MDTVSFDLPRLHAFATALRQSASGAADLHRDVARLLADVDHVIAGQAYPANGMLDASGSGGFSHGLPGRLADSLQAIADSIDRRCAQVEGCQALLRQGWHLDPDGLFLDEPPPDLNKVGAAVDVVERLNATMSHPVLKLGGISLYSDDLQDEQREVREALGSLTGAELDLFLEQVSDHDLRGAGWSLMSLGDRVDLSSALLAKASLVYQSKLLAAFPWLDPKFDTAFNEDQQHAHSRPELDVHYDVPADPLFWKGIDIAPKRPFDLDAADVQQGQVGDCWFLATLIATAQANPQFIRDSIKENPNGTVSVRLWDADRHERWVTVTRDLPLYRNGAVAVAHGQGSMWSAYFEKAFTVLYSQHYDGRRGDYAAIEGDSLDMAAPYLTGHPSRSLSTLGIPNPIGMIGMDYHQVEQAFNAGHPVIVGSNLSTDNVPADLKQAYVANHAYYVEAVYDGKIVLGNPWGRDTPSIEVTGDQFKALFNNPQVLDVGG